MTLKKDYDDLNTNGTVGDWYFSIGDDGQEYIGILLPTDLAILPVCQPNQTRINANAWSWDGNKVAPTLVPSILHHSKPPWHGFLREGKLVSV